MIQGAVLGRAWRRRACRAAALILLFAGLARAEFIRVTAIGGSSAVSPSQVNQELDDWKGLFTDAGSAVTKESRLGSAYFFVADADFHLFRGLSFGPRLEWMELLGAGMEASQAGGQLKLEYGGRVVPLMLGVHYEWPLPAKDLRLQATADAGWAYGLLFKRATLSGPGAYSATADYSAWNLCGELGLGFHYKLAEGVSLQLGGGYLWANFPEMTARYDEPVFFKAKKDGTAHDLRGRPLAVDLSGLKISTGVGVEF